MTGNISVDFDEATAAIRLVVAQLAPGVIPAPGPMSVARGADIDVTKRFHAQLETTAEGMAQYVISLREDLVLKHDDMVATITALANADSELAGEARALLGTLDSIAGTA